MVHFAHSTDRTDRADWHRLKDHLLATGAAAAERAAKFGASPLGDLAGRLHDLGKYSERFQSRLAGASISVDHSTAGAQLVAREYGPLGKLLAFCIAGHHAGLANGTHEPEASGTAALAERLEQETEALDPIWRQEVPLECGQVRLPAFKARDPGRVGFQYAFFTRMLFSCLVDADYLDTEAFYDRVECRTHARGGHPSLAALQEHLHRYLAGIAARADATAVNRLRGRVLAHARSRAAEAPGLFSLTVPTAAARP